MTKTEQVIRRAEKAVPLADAGLAEQLRFHIAELKKNPFNGDSQVAIRKLSNLAYRRERFANFILN